MMARVVLLNCYFDLRKKLGYLNAHLVEIISLINYRQFYWESHSVTWTSYNTFKLFVDNNVVYISLT